MKSRIAVGIAIAVLLVALATTAAAQESETTPPPQAVAQMFDVQGRNVGMATFTTLDNGDVQVRVQVAGFEPVGGDRGIHIHAVGECERPDFRSAGSHFNPTRSQHGFQNPEGPHAGDLPNIQFYPNGSADYRVTTNLFTLDQLFDDNGSAIVIHADPDDYVTDPAGESGRRIACGVITAVGETPAAPAPAATAEPAEEAAEPATPPVQAAGVAPETAVTGATAQMFDVQDRNVGTATFTTLDNGDVQVRVQVAGFDPVGGDHGIHVHAVAQCQRPDFQSAGGHFNPTNARHGFQNPEGPHAGDLPNIQFYPNGSADYRVTTNLFTLDQLFDADGSALVIHAGPDDYVTDPAGNSGDRIACGVIVPSAEPAEAAAGQEQAPAGEEGPEEEGPDEE